MVGRHRVWFPLLLSALACNGRGPFNEEMLDAAPVAPSVIDAGGADSSVESDEPCNDYDDNGDGRVDEACFCNPGDVKPCFPGSLDTPGRAICERGTQTCEPEFEFGRWGECVGAVFCEDGEETFLYGEMTVSRPVDVVMSVDQSGSMSTEIASVKANVNRFADAILESGIDIRLIMIAYRGTDAYGICVPPPLGGAGCADSERYFQIDQVVASTNALSLMEAHIATIESHMRSPSLRVFVVVTDDNSSESAAGFDAFLAARSGYTGYVFHGIIGTAECAGTASIGTVYQALAMLTGGTTEGICTPDWGDTFERFATDIIERTLVFTLEGVPYDDVRVFARNDVGFDVEIPPDGWTYDPISNTITLHLDYTPEDGSVIVVRYRREIDP